MLESNFPELFKSDLPKLLNVSKCPEFEEFKVLVTFSESWVDSVQLIIEKFFLWFWNPKVLGLELL